MLLFLLLRDSRFELGWPNTFAAFQGHRNRSANLPRLELTLKAPNNKSAAGIA